MNHNSGASGTDASQNGDPDTPSNLGASTNLTAAGNMAAPANLAPPAVNQQQLNAARRPQRLYLKVKVAMKLAVERISDRRYTEIGHFLSAEKLAEFKLEVRVQIRRRLDETMDTWQIRTNHDYRPDIRVAIGKAMEAKWHLFECDLDDFVPSELLLPAFYEE